MTRKIIVILPEDFSVDTFPPICQMAVVKDVNDPPKAGFLHYEIEHFRPSDFLSLKALRAILAEKIARDGLDSL